MITRIFQFIDNGTECLPAVVEQPHMVVFRDQRFGVIQEQFHQVSFYRQPGITDKNLFIEKDELILDEPVERHPVVHLLHYDHFTLFRIHSEINVQDNPADWNQEEDQYPREGFDGILVFEDDDHHHDDNRQQQRDIQQEPEEPLVAEIIEYAGNHRGLLKGKNTKFF
jgi:hypothetical protein